MRAGRFAAAGLVLLAGAGFAAGCASTEFFNEGPGEPMDRTKGTVPAGSVGVCKRPLSKRPPIVNAALWEHAPVCNARTPDTFARIGYGREPEPGDVEADKQVEKLMTAIGDAADPADKDGNNKFLAMLRALQDYALKRPELRDRVTRESSRPMPCDFTYMLQTMATERAKVEAAGACTSYVYDVKERHDVCLFDMAQKGVAWLTGSWDCITRTVPTEAQSCHELCAFDDYCVRQVSCAASDIDLTLCAAGVCLPEARNGVF